ncbi:MAG: hypothetical protein HQL12_07905 [Candidatus Omnitrophica bacterium]|nr:hypothetical protein [Candidatus Omnitrophota bacterium]
MAKLFVKGIIGILLLGVLGVFILRIYQQSEVLSEIYHWVFSGKYIFEGLDDGRMRQKLKIQELNNATPPLDKIFNASLSSGDVGLKGADIEKCQHYYQLILQDMPQMQESHVFLGFCESKAENIPQAILEFKQGLKSGAGAFWASYDLGVLATMDGNKDAAEAFFIQTIKFPLQDVIKNIFASKLFQQYMQVNDITPRKLWDGLNGARDDAIQNLKSIEYSKTSTSAISPTHEMRLRIF